MSAKYKLVLRKDMRKDAQPSSKLYYASANTTRTCDLYEFCDEISSRSTASPGDVKLILDESVGVLRRNLGKGEVVRMGELGSFQFQFGSSGAVTEKEFSQNQIKNRRIVFRPGKQLKDALAAYTFEKIAATPVTPTPPAEGGDENPDIL